MDPLRLLGLTEHHIIPVCCNPIHPMGFSNWSWGLFNTFCFSRWTLPILAGETHKCKDLQQQCIVANLYIIAMMTKFWRGHSVMLCTRDGLCELHSQGRTVRCRGRHQTCIRIQRCPHPLPHNAHTDFFEVSHVTLPFCSVSSCKHFIQCHGGGEGAPALVALCWYIDQVRPKLWSVAFHANEHHHHHHWWWWGGRWYLFFYILTKWAVKWCPSCKCSLKTPHSLSDKHCLPLPRCNDQLKNKNLGCHFKRKFCVIVYAGKCM